MKKTVITVLIAVLIFAVIAPFGVASAQAPQITVWVSNNSLMAAGPVSLKVTLTNAGADPITDVKLHYPTPDQTEVAIGDIPAGESREYDNAQWYISDDMFGHELNFTVSWTEADGTSKSGIAPGIIITKQEATVSASASASANVSTVKKGESVVYTFSLTNNGNVEFTNVTLSASPLRDGAALTDPFTVQPGATEQLEWTVTLDQTTQITPVFTYTANGTTQKTAADAVTVTVEEEKTALLRLTVTADKQKVKADEEVKFQIALANTGNANITGISVKDFDGGTVTLSRNTLSPGENATGSTTLTIPSTGRYVFTVSAVDEEGNTISAQSDPISIEVEGTATPSASIDPTTALLVQATADKTTLTEPGEVSFTVTVENMSTETFTNVTLTESTTGASTAVPEIAAGAKETWNTVIPVDETTEFKFAVSATLPDGTSISASALPVTITMETQRSGLSTFQIILIVFVVAIAGVATALGIFIYKGKKAGLDGDGKNAKAAAKTATRQPERTAAKTAQSQPQKAPVREKVTPQPKKPTAKAKKKNVRFGDRNKI